MRIRIDSQAQPSHCHLASPTVEFQLQLPLQLESENTTREVKVGINRQRKCDE